MSCPCIRSRAVRAGSPSRPGTISSNSATTRCPAARRSRLLRFAYAPLYIARAALGIRRLIGAEAIGIVRATDPYWAAAFGWMATRGMPARFCVSIHADWDVRHDLDPASGAPKLFGSRRLAKALERFLLRRAERVLCIRRSLFDYALRSGARPESLRLFPHGIDLARFRTPPPVPEGLGLPSGRKLVVFAGRLSRENYVDDTLAVARALAPRGDTTLVIVGGGPEEARLRAYVAADPALSGAVHFTGFQSRETVIALRFAAAVNLVPMGGFSLIEACASGRPAVAYDIEWHAELVEDGRSGLLVSAGDSTALAAAVAGLLDEPGRADALGAAGRERAFALHEMNRVFEIRRAVYADLMGESPDR